MAAKVAYRPDQYPTDSATTLPLFQLTAPPAAPAPTTQSKAEASPVADTRPAKAKPTRTPKAETPAPEVIPPKPKTTPTTPREARLVKTAAEIASERPDDDDRGYMHSIMCQVGLPRSKVDATSFERHSGGAALLVEAGKLWDGKQFVQQPIPYGPMPRLMLAWMNTYAVRFNTAEIPVGDSASEFLRMLGKTPNGEKQRLHDLPQAGSGLVGLSDHPRLQRQRTRAHLRRKAHQAFRGVDRFNRGTAPLVARFSNLLG